MSLKKLQNHQSFVTAVSPCSATPVVLLLSKEGSVKLFILKPLVGENVILVTREFIADVSWLLIHMQYWTLVV